VYSQFTSGVTSSDASLIDSYYSSGGDVYGTSFSRPVSVSHAIYYNSVYRPYPELNLWVK
jgi:hypothetical protein